MRKQVEMLEHDGIARRTMNGGRRRWVFDGDRLARQYDNYVRWRSDSPREQIRRARIASG
ncbi:hypothetical protein KBY77_16250 [Synechococcus sp. Cruz-7E5]|nr:hypothetical protein [Synechococcus sp. Edmonson 11F2]MCP9864667.1 hypothetical protein [Synechococcus sp. Cruz-7E5]